MGDLIELTTWPNHQNVFYEMTGSGFLFEVKAHSNAAIGLAKETGSKCDVIIALGYNESSWIKSSHNEIKKCSTPDILSDEEFRSFWVSWNAGCVRLGREGETRPIITLQCKLPDLRYATFSVIDNESPPIHWKFIVAPIMDKPKIKNIEAGALYWAQVDPETQFPDGAIIAGYENENLYIIRAPHRRSLTPGKFVSSEGVGYVPWGGEAQEKNDFEVLCGFDYIWVSSQHGQIPVGAVVGGHSEGRDLEKLYIGRVKHNGHLIPGKVQPSHKVCYIPFEGAEVANEKYEVLVVPRKTHTANKFMMPHIDMSDFNENYDDDDDGDDNHSHDPAEEEDYDDYPRIFAL